jgi:hypothetical protein
MKTSHVWKAVTSSITTGAAAALLGTEPLAVQKLSDWSVPVNLGPLVNSASHDTYAVVSKKGLSLYFASNRPGSEGVDLWVSQRPSQDAGWGPPVNLGSHINTPFVEDAPALSRDEHWLFFDSTRPDGHGGLDHWASWRANPHDDFGWLPAVNLGAGINTPFLDAGPAPFANDDAGVPLLFFVSNRPGGLGANDIYFSQLLPDGVYDAGTRVPAGTQQPTGGVQADGPLRRARDCLRVQPAGTRPGIYALGFYPQRGGRRLVSTGPAGPAHQQWRVRERAVALAGWPVAVLQRRPPRRRGRCRPPRQHAGQADGQVVSRIQGTTLRRPRRSLDAGSGEARP